MMESIIRDIGTLLYIVPISPEHGSYGSVSDVPDYVERAIPYFLLLCVLEFLYGLKTKYKLYSLKDVVLSISLGIVQQLVGVWAKEALIFPYLFVYDLFAPMRQKVLESQYWPAMDAYQYQLLMFVVGFLGCDLGYYFLHRTAHEWQLLWSAHSVHHSGERYNFATALRQGSFQTFYSWFFYIPLAAMGLPVTHFIRHNRLNTVYQFWIHTEIVGRCPWLVELVMNTPSHHRMHHRPPGNCNYAGVLIIWDRIFCTFQSERHLPKTKVTLTADSALAGTGAGASKSWLTSRGVIYGLAKPLDNYDPVYANICHLLRLTAPKKAVGSEVGDDVAEPSWLLNRICKLLSVSVTKRIKQNLTVATTAAELMPDVLVDWEIESEQVQKNSVPYLQHLWNELWELPPPVDENRLEDSAGADATPSDNTPVLKSEFCNRDKQFLIGRKARESPTLSFPLAVAVTVQFLLSLAVGYSVLLFAGKSSADAHDVCDSAAVMVNSTSCGADGVGGEAAALAGLTAKGEETRRICMALVCISCVLSLQTIKLYYK